MKCTILRSTELFSNCYWILLKKKNYFKEMFPLEADAVLTVVRLPES